MATTCRQCGGAIKPNMEKLKIVLGGGAAVALMGMMPATPAGWLALLPAACAGSASAMKILQMKARVWAASDKAGAFFECGRCGRDIPLGELFG